MDYLHLHKEIDDTCYRCRLQQLDDDFPRSKNMPETVQSFLPQRTPKSVMTHEHVTCTLDAGGDTPQLTPKEIRPVARYARQPTDAFEDPKPHAPGRDLVRENGGYGLP